MNASPQLISRGSTGLVTKSLHGQKCLSISNAVLARSKYTTATTNSYKSRSDSSVHPSLGCTGQEDSTMIHLRNQSHSQRQNSSLFSCLSLSSSSSASLSSMGNSPFLSTQKHQYTQLFRKPNGLLSPPQLSSSLIFRRSIITNHHFNTNKIVSKLESNGFQRGQAEGIMRVIKAFIGQHTNKVRKNMLTRSDLENETYLFKAALTELRTELQILRKNDAAALAIRSEIISREIDSLNQKLREDIANVKNDIAIDMNSRKSDVREEQKQLEIRIQSMSNHYMAQLGDMRTRMEAAKWEATRKGMVTIFISASFVLLMSRMFMKDEKVPDDYIDPYVNHSNAQNSTDGMVPDSFVVSHRT